MQLQFIILAAVCGYLRKFLIKEEKLPQWQRIFLWGFVFSLIILFYETYNPSIRSVTKWLAPLAFIGLVWLIFTDPVFKAIRGRVYIVLPYLLVKIVQDIFQAVAKDFYRAHSGYFETAGVFAFIWLVVMLIISNKQRKELALEKQKAAEKEREFLVTEKLKAQLEVQVAERTAELLQQKQSLEQAILDLKATQRQLIHAEKMASLGELTAGIAHEIQNPLNFVNNFSELNKELVAEMKAEIAQGNMDEIKAIADIIASNEEKINQHGKRADGIVKGMLQHSRSSNGQKELTDINQLCDEYLRLAYHGLRAKDKTFNASFETNFEAQLPKISIVPQDIGRVLLNLVNNAFYAVNDKRKSAGDDYKPTVTVHTKLLEKDGDKQVEVTVIDNGDGMPSEITEKIFQPFFTTKPTGQGTGLGLSLSYDIVQAHGGLLSVETKEGVGTLFSFNLPV